MSQLESVLIVGGGAFGLSTAWELVKGKYKGHGGLITVLDRCDSPPAADAASSDYNKVRTTTSRIDRACAYAHTYRL